MEKHLPLPECDEPPSGVIIERVQPEIDGGRYPVKRVEGDILEVSADIFKDGHDKIAAVVKYRRQDEDDWQEAEMRLVENDRWAGEVLLPTTPATSTPSRPSPTSGPPGVTRSRRRSAPGRTSRWSCSKGAPSSPRRCRAPKGTTARSWRRRSPPSMPAAARRRPCACSWRRRSRRRCAAPAPAAAARVYCRELEVVVDRPAARFAAWYEMFPRSAGTDPTRGATFAEAADRLPAIADMGFDVVYLPPIHPIGRAFRKGKNNTLAAGPDDPGVPYAIGSEEGGHDAIEPGLGTLDDFRAFVARAASLGMEVALDVAVQASPDHPWAKEHPEWFTIRPDGTIRYAENPPKKYQDIYPINFDSPDWRELWLELRRVILFWVEQGVKTFRVDNPHTKPTVFWEWLIADVQRAAPGRDLPLRGVHAAEGDEVAGQGGLHAELHLLHLAQFQVRSWRSTSPS